MTLKHFHKRTPHICDTSLLVSYHSPSEFSEIVATFGMMSPLRSATVGDVAWHKQEKSRAKSDGGRSQHGLYVFRQPGGIRGRWGEDSEYDEPVRKGGCRFRWLWIGMRLDFFLCWGGCDRILKDGFNCTFSRVRVIILEWYAVSKIGYVLFYHVYWYIKMII